MANLKAVAAHDPEDAEGLTLLAWMAYVDGKPEEAAAVSTVLFAASFGLVMVTYKLVAHRGDGPGQSGPGPGSSS